MADYPLDNLYDARWNKIRGLKKFVDVLTVSVVSSPIYFQVSGGHFELNVEKTWKGNEVNITFPSHQSVPDSLVLKFKMAARGTRNSANIALTILQEVLILSDFSSFD